MTEPTRLRDEGSDDARALLRAAPRSRPMSPDDRTRSRARVARTAASLAAGAGLVATLQGAAAGAVLGLITVGATMGMPSWLSRSSPGEKGVQAPATATALPSPPPSAHPSEASPASASPDPSQRPAARPAPAASEAAPPDSPPSPADTLSEEVALLEKARAALGASPTDALALTEAHASRFPAGKLVVERELVAVDALRRLGRASEARARGEALLSRPGAGAYEERIKKLLEGR